MQANELPTFNESSFLNPCLLSANEDLEIDF